MRFAAASSRRRFALVAATLAVVPASADASLRSQISKLVTRSGIARSTSVTVRTLDGTVLYDRTGSLGRIPASNEKLVTELAALDSLHADGRLTTRAVAGAPALDGVIEGGIYLVGGGDPQLSTAMRVRRLGLRGVATLERLAAALRAAGIERIRGGVIGDGSAFDAARGGPGWKRGFLPDQCPPLSALAVDRNAGPNGAVWEPERRAARLFRQALRRAGIAVSGRSRTGIAPTTAVEIARVQSRPVAGLLRALGKDSDNFTAEMLLKAIAARHERPGSTRGGVSYARSLLTRRGFTLEAIRLADGSGLSLRNRLSTQFLTALLVAAARDPSAGPALRDSLAIAGVDGTLEDRMRSGPAHGVVRAKTGTISEASALSGYAGSYVFSVIVNGRVVNVTRARALQDAIAQRLADS